jgi:putative hydrolase of the HAD superfamily
MTELPRAMLIDMDDTILSAYGRPELAWNIVATEFESEFAPLPPREVATAILAAARKFWSTADAVWRLKLHEARQITVKNGLAALAAAGKARLPAELAIRIADRFTAYREEETFVFPGAHDAIDALKALGVKLALVTNGAAGIQRAKVERFALTHRFDHIQIEGEHGFGKPEERAYLHAMQALGVEARDTWMIGDNLEWEVEAPQRLGIYAIWVDTHGEGLPPDSAIKPDRIIRSLTELLPTDWSCGVSAAAPTKSSPRRRP